MPGMKGKGPVILGLILIGNSVKGWSYAEIHLATLWLTSPQWPTVVLCGQGLLSLADVAKIGSCDDKERIWVW